MKKCYRNNQMPEGARASESAIIYGCDACEYMHDNELITCSKFIGLSGKDPSSEDVYKDTYQCVDSWVPILMIENSKQGMSTTVAVENMRNSLNESIGIVNANLKNSVDAMSNAQMMNKLEQRVVDHTPKIEKAVSTPVPQAQVTEGVYSPSDIYGG